MAAPSKNNGRFNIFLLVPLRLKDIDIIEYWLWFSAIQFLANTVSSILSIVFLQFFLKKFHILYGELILLNTLRE